MLAHSFNDTLVLPSSSGDANNSSTVLYLPSRCRRGCSSHLSASSHMASHPCPPPLAAFTATSFTFLTTRPQYSRLQKYSIAHIHPSPSPSHLTPRSNSSGPGPSSSRTSSSRANRTANTDGRWSPGETASPILSMRTHTTSIVMHPLRPGPVLHAAYRRLPYPSRTATTPGPDDGHPYLVHHHARMKEWTNPRRNSVSASAVTNSALANHAAMGSLPWLGNARDVHAEGVLCQP